MTTLTLPPQALRVLAEKINSGAGGYREGWKIIRLFADAGFTPAFTIDECGSRDRYTERVLTEFTGPDLASFLCYLVHPHTYPRDPQLAEAVRQEFNELLLPHGWQLEGGFAPALRSVAQALPQVGSPPQTTLHPQREFDFSRLTSDPRLQQQLKERWEEAIALHQMGTHHRFALIAVGALLEGALLAKAMSDLKTANTATGTPKDRSGAVKPIKEWTFAELIEVAKQVGWVKPMRASLSNILRDYRNFIHPYKELNETDSIDAPSVELAWNVMRAALEDLTH